MESRFPRIGLFPNVHMPDVKMTWDTLVKTLAMSVSFAAVQLLKQSVVGLIFVLPCIFDINYINTK